MLENVSQLLAFSDITTTLTPWLIVSHFVRRGPLPQWRSIPWFTRILHASWTPDALASRILLFIPYHLYQLNHCQTVVTCVLQNTCNPLFSVLCFSVYFSVPTISYVFAPFPCFSLYLLISNQFLPLVKATRNFLFSVRLWNPFQNFNKMPKNCLSSCLNWNTPEGRYVPALPMGLLDFTCNSHRNNENGNFERDISLSWQGFHLSWAQVAAWFLTKTFILLPCMYLESRNKEYGYNNCCSFPKVTHCND